MSALTSATDTLPPVLIAVVLEPLLLAAAGKLHCWLHLPKLHLNWFLLEIDNALPAASRRRAIDILTENKATFHLQLFSGVAHGFATKGDPNVENSRKSHINLVAFEVSRSF